MTAVCRDTKKNICLIIIIRAEREHAASPECSYLSSHLWKAGIFCRNKICFFYYKCSTHTHTDSDPQQNACRQRNTSMKAPKEHLFRAFLPSDPAVFDVARCVSAPYVCARPHTTDLDNSHQRKLSRPRQHEHHGRHPPTAPEWSADESLELPND